MRREIFLDTETTGLTVEDKHRIIEVAAISYVNRKPLENGVFHSYCDPQREVPADAVEIHGMNNSFLTGKPLFADIAKLLQDFVRDGDVYIHNAEFDSKFLDNEFKAVGLPPLAEVAHSVSCTIKISKSKNPHMHRHNLDTLCRHYGVDDSARGKHNALLDVKLLANVYYAMTREQMAMGMKPGDGNRFKNARVAEIIVQRATSEERAAHEAYLDNMEKDTGVKSVYRGGKPPAKVVEEKDDRQWYEKAMG